MTADITSIARMYAVVPGKENPATGKTRPEGFEAGYDGINSAIELAKHLSAGGGKQSVIEVRGPRSRVIAEFRAGKVTWNVSGSLIPPPDFTPASVTEIRAGSPHGHIPEICTHAKMRAEPGRKRRRNPNMPPAQWPGIIDN